MLACLQTLTCMMTLVNLHSTQLVIQCVYTVTLPTH